MSVSLHGHSTSTTVEQSLQDMVCYYARVSNPANQNNTLTNDRLVSYLIRNQHWSPFEMVSICLEINTTRDIARQILRHRSFSFQEFSQRYADVSVLSIKNENESNTFMCRETRLQDHKNRQNSIECDLDNLDDDTLDKEWQEKQKEIQELSMSTYEWALQKGIAKEVARAVLPEGLTPSRMYMNGTLRSWIHYIELRSSNGTQKEHREIAMLCAKAIEPIFPMIMTLI
jgi:thymidylate synthase (FAD)